MPWCQARSHVYAAPDQGAAPTRAETARRPRSDRPCDCFVTPHDRHGNLSAMRSRCVLLVPAAVCALATHALVYRSLWPSDAAHGYFAWYEPLVGGASLASLLGVVAAVFVASSGRRLPPLTLRARPLACTSLAFLLAQETLERSTVLGRFALPSLSPEQWIVLVAGIAATALALTLAARAGHAAACRLLSRPEPARRDAAPLRWSVVTAVPRRPRPLAVRSGLRAPPLLAG
jgi:hypothetical protein